MTRCFAGARRTPDRGTRRRTGQTNNPVHHGYVKLWTEWPWSSAAEYLERTGRAEAEQVWKEYPILDYGRKWDDAGI